MAAPHIFPALFEAKQALRARMLAARAGWDGAASGRAVGDRVLASIPPPPDAVVAGFWPLEGELDLRPLLRGLHRRGHPVVLPVTPRRGEPLTFRLWTPGAQMERERFGTFRPTGAERTPTFLLVPLLAFDRRGGRLGYGAGYYDRTLPHLPGRFALGCAFAAQEVEAVPMGPDDIRLDAVATETETIRLS